MGVSSIYRTPFVNHLPKPYTRGHQPNPTLNTILDVEWLSFVHGRPRLSAPKDVKKDVKSVGRAASTEGSQEMRMAYCPPLTGYSSPTQRLQPDVPGRGCEARA
jgi:hypothetical protein